MSYSAQADLQNLLTPAQLVQLTDDNADGLADAAPITEAIAESAAEIDGYLGARYTVPIAPVPVLLKNLSVAIALWKLYSRRSILNEARRKAYEDARATLTNLSKGTMVLPAQGGGQVASASGDSAVADTSTDDRLFTMGKDSDGSSGTLDAF